MQDRENRDLVQVLIENPDPATRSQAHTELGRRAAAKDDVEKALAHYREAAVLDPTDETPRQAIASLGASVQSPPLPRRSALRRLFKGLSRR